LIEARWFVGGDPGDARVIRRKVFIEEQGADGAAEADGRDGSAIHLVAYDGGAPVAAGRVIPEADAAVIGRVAVLKEERGKGYGDFVMKTLVWLAAEMRYDTLVVHSRLSAAGFFRKFGFKPAGGEYEEAGVTYVTMVRKGGAKTCGSGL